MKQLIEKLSGHTDRLVDVFLAIIRGYAVVAPMMFDERVVAAYGQEAKAMGFQIVRQTLLLGVILDLVKITVDEQDSRIPSIANIISALDDGKVVEYLRAQQVDRQYLEPITVLTEAENAARLQREKDQMGRRFDERLANLNKNWPKLRDSPQLAVFKAVRDRYLAHLEVRFDPTTRSYRILSLEDVGLKWGDANHVISLTKDVVDDLNLVVRQAGFDWKGFEKQNEGIALGFWPT